MHLSFTQGLASTVQLWSTQGHEDVQRPRDVIRGLSHQHLIGTHDRPGDRQTHSPYALKRHITSLLLGSSPPCPIASCEMQLLKHGVHPSSSEQQLVGKFLGIPESAVRKGCITSLGFVIRNHSHRRTCCKPAAAMVALA